MSHGTMAGKFRQIAFLGNHLPRQCGIATFTADLSGAIAAEFPTADCLVVAMNDAGKRMRIHRGSASKSQRMISRRTASQRIF